MALHTGIFPDPVEIGLPGGRRASFALAHAIVAEDYAEAAVVKDAGDDPDVTHGALIVVRVWQGAPGTGVVFQAGTGVGTVTRPGLPLPPGEPAINPVPRAMIRAALTEIVPEPDARVRIAVPDGEALAEHTLNGRLGIVGGLSILGTTGIVIPFSCAAWIDTIHRGIDVARAMSLPHVAGSTGKVSETAVQALHGLPDVALLEMGDFVGGMLKYLRTHPVPRITIAGGVAKMTKLAQGRLDLHSKRGAADLQALSALAGDPAIAGANTVAEAFAMAAESGIALGDAVAQRAWNVAAEALAGCGSLLEIAVFDRQGVLVGRTPFAAVQDATPPRNRRA